MNAPRFITLTLQADARPLSDQLDHLMESFRRLRQSPLWRRTQHAGVYAIEVTYNRRTGLWHPHLHVIADGEFVAQQQLSEAWKQASGGSIIVDIRAVHDRRRAARYISRYVAKPLDVTEWPVHAVCQYAVALTGRRMLHTFGGLHGHTPDTAPPTAARGRPKSIVYCETIRERAVWGDPAAVRALHLAARMGPLWAAALGVQTHARDATPDPLTTAEAHDLAQALAELAQPPPEERTTVVEATAVRPERTTIAEQPALW